MPVNKIEPKALQLKYSEFKSRKKSLTGMKIDKYVIYEQLGQGAFGSVFKGMNDQTKEEVAVKLLDLEAVQQQTSQYVKKIKRRLCKTESEMMLKCDSENLIKCYDIYQNKSLKVMVIQYCNGGELEHEINKNGYLPEDQAISVLKQILNGLAELHNKGIVHRDLKPENILVHNGIYKIADFGFCKQFVDSKDETHELRQTKLGTISTMAPEVMSGKAYGLKADIWSIGVIFYNMIYGRLPYTKLSYDQILREISNKNIFDPKFVGVCIKPSKSAKDFIQNCLAIDSKQRMTWKQISDHPLFQVSEVKIKKKQHGGLDSVFRRNVDLNINTMKTLDKKQINQDESEQELSTPHITNTEKPRVLDAKQLKQKRKEMTKQRSTIVFTWSKTAYFQCLKTELILNQIFQPLEKCGQKLTDDRQGIEIMYLLITRCFNNMSFKNSEMKKKKDNIVKDLLENIDSLYKIVEEKFQNYALKLTKKESQVFQVVKDKFAGLLRSQEAQQKDKFLTGNQFNENIQNQLYAYSKDEQIHYTQKLLNQKFQFLKGLKLEKNTLQHIIKYERICTLKQIELGDEKFNNYVAKHFL